MKKSKYTEEQIIGFLNQAGAGMPVKELCRKGGFSDATFYKWRSKFGGLEVPDAWASSRIGISIRELQRPLYGALAMKGLTILHGKTRRGGLGFDVADLVKDAVILPQAFISAMRGATEQEFRQACIETLTRSESLDFMIDTLKAVAARVGQIAQRQGTA